MYHVLENFRGRKIGIVGLGYIGNHLFRYLDHFSKEYEFSVLAFNKANSNLLSGATFDYFFNCAGNTGDFRSKIWSTVDSNLFLARYLMENIKITECYVSLSSTRLYGFTSDKNVLFTENSQLTKDGDHLSIDFIYDGTKMLLESILWNYNNKVDYRISICRLSNLYGRYNAEDLNDSTYLKVMIRSHVEGKRLLVEQNVLNTKGYIFIDDAIQGIIHSAIYSEKSDIYNICSGESYSIENWLKYLKVDYVIGNSGKPDLHSRNSIAKAVTELKFKPQYFLNNLEFNKIFQNGSNKAV